MNEPGWTGRREAITVEQPRFNRPGDAAWHEKNQELTTEAVTKAMADLQQWYEGQGEELPGCAIFVIDAQTLLQKSNESSRWYDLARGSRSARGYAYYIGGFGSFDSPEEKELLMQAAMRQARAPALNAVRHPKPHAFLPPYFPYTLEPCDIEYSNPGCVLHEDVLFSVIGLPNEDNFSVASTLAESVVSKSSHTPPGHSVQSAA